MCVFQCPQASSFCLFHFPCTPFCHYTSGICFNLHDFYCPKEFPFLFPVSFNLNRITLSYYHTITHPFFHTCDIINSVSYKVTFPDNCTLNLNNWKPSYLYRFLHLKRICDTSEFTQQFNCMGMTFFMWECWMSKSEWNECDIREWKLPTDKWWNDDSDHNTIHWYPWLDFPQNWNTEKKSIWHEKMITSTYLEICEKELRSKLQFFFSYLAHLIQKLIYGWPGCCKLNVLKQWWLYS